MPDSNQQKPYIEVLYDYLEETLLSSKSLTKQHAKEIFLKALRDYFNNRINLHYLASVATKIYYHFYQPHEIDSYDYDLGKALSYATEIDWDFENMPKEVFENEIKLLKDYYEKNIVTLKIEGKSMERSHSNSSNDKRKSTYEQPRELSDDGLKEYLKRTGLDERNFSAPKLRGILVDRLNSFFNGEVTTDFIIGLASRFYEDAVAEDDEELLGVTCEIQDLVYQKINGRKVKYTKQQVENIFRSALERLTKT